MRVSEHREGRIVGHVQVKVASRVYSVPVRAVSLTGTEAREGFFAEGEGGFGILVDSSGTEENQRATIERATAEAAQFLARKFLN